jgi:hypothetical protein
MVSCPFDRREYALLEDLQELDLARDGQVTDLVQEDPAMLGAPLEDSVVPVDRTDESPLAVPKQFRGSPVYSFQRNTRSSPCTRLHAATVATPSAWQRSPT